MQMPFLRTIASLAFLIGVGRANSAEACIDIAPFEIEDIRQADAIFTGKLVRYERVSPGRPASLQDYAILTVRVDQVIKGSATGDIRLYWWNSTFGVPEEEEIDAPLLIAAVNGTHRILPLRGGSATVFPSRRPDLLQLMQAPCSSPFLLDGTQQNVANVRKILRGESVGQHDYFAVRNAEAERRTKALAEHKSQMRKLMAMLGSVVAVIAATAMLVGWRRKSVRP